MSEAKTAADLRAAVQSEQPEQRLEAILAVRDRAPPEPALVKAVLAHVTHTHPGLRQAALEVLAGVAHRFPQALPAGSLEAVLARRADANPRVRAEAAAALALVEEQRDSPARKQAVLELLADEDPEVREQAAAAAGDLGLEAAIPPLAELLSDPTPAVALEAAFALASLKDPRARLPLEAALAHKRSRYDACEGLRRLGDPAAIPALQATLRGWFIDRIAQLSLRAALYALGERDQAQPLIDHTRSWRLPERTHAYALIGSHQVLEAEPLLLTQVQDPKARDRSLAMAALAQLPGGEAPLLAVATDPSESLDARLDAVDALDHAHRRPALAQLAATADPQLTAAAPALAALTQT